jgi:RNA polymerase sigma factor (sigma-70 family)
VSTTTQADLPRTTGDESSCRAAFVTTHWSVVLTANRSDTTRAQVALAHLCETYWYPLYAFVRRQGHSPHDAQDLTQEFFARLLAKGYLQAAAREKGRFRTFLLVVLKRFLANEWDHLRARKRGGGQIHVPLDTDLAERRYQAEPEASIPADKVYERRWALTLLEQTMSRLRQEFLDADKRDAFEHLKVCLAADRGAIDYGDIASKTGMNKGAVRVAVHRLRRRFREVFREEIAHTVSGPDEIEAEVHHLLAALSE